MIYQVNGYWETENELNPTTYENFKGSITAIFSIISYQNGTHSSVQKKCFLLLDSNDKEYIFCDRKKLQEFITQLPPLKSIYINTRKSKLSWDGLGLDTHLINNQYQRDWCNSGYCFYDGIYYSSVICTNRKEMITLRSDIIYTVTFIQDFFDDIIIIDDAIFHVNCEVDSKEDFIRILKEGISFVGTSGTPVTVERFNDINLEEVTQEEQ